MGDRHRWWERIGRANSPARPLTSIPWGTDAETAALLVSNQIQRDQAFRYSLIATAIILVTALRWDLSSPIAVILWIAASVSGILLACSALSSPWIDQARSKATPQLVKNLLIGMHRAYLPQHIQSAGKLVEASLGAVKSARDLSMHEWETIASLTLEGEKSFGPRALEAVSRCKVHAVVPILRMAVEMNSENHWRFDRVYDAELQKTIDRLEAARREEGSQEHVPLHDPQGWPDRDLDWFMTALRWRTLSRFMEGAIRLAGAAAAFRLFGAQPAGAIILGIICGYLVDVFIRSQDPSEESKRKFFPTDNVPGPVFLEALRKAPISWLSRKTNPLRDYLILIGGGARDFTSLSKDDWRFLLQRLDAEKGSLGLVLTEILGQNGPAELLADIDGKLDRALESKSRTSPREINRLTRVKMLLLSRMSEPEKVPPVTGETETVPEIP